ncbi:MAG: S41 family peptidase [Cyclobacteriaceae bacterium]|nr:S41 family peptidase [Cyclobacteriaceae bacterium]
MKRKIFVFSFIIVLLSATALAPLTDRYFEIARNLDIFASLFKEVNTYYVDEVSPGMLMKTAIDNMLGSLDPYTNYIPADMVEDFRTANTGQYGGIGAMTRQIGKRTVVSMVFPGFAAHRGGLKVGDEVLKIDGRDITSLTQEEAGQLMKGEVGKPVKLTVKRYGIEEPITLELKREKIKISNVPWFGMIDHETGYIRLSEFTPEAGKNVRSAVIKLKEQKASRLILDLRNNPGGLLMEAVNVCNVFIPKGKKVASTKGRLAEHNETYETLDAPVDTEIPLAVIINRGSASASEVVAGTLQDYDRAIVIGERSFGKGLVQIQRPLSYNAQLKITTARYYIPSGRCVQVLDYSHRREDGSAASIPDSLKKAFTTINGRTVYEAGGIEPDLIITEPEVHPLVVTLHQEGLLFDYATRYVATKPAPANARNFSLSDADYQDFLSWMKNQRYHYESQPEKSLELLKKTTVKERYSTELREQLNRIGALLTSKRKDELLIYRQAIEKELAEEIITHYFLEAGFVEFSLKNDENIKAATGLLADTNRYKKILRLQ